MDKTMNQSNLFVGSEHLCIGDLVTLDIPVAEFDAIISQWRKDGGTLPVFGECSIQAVDEDPMVRNVWITTSRRMSEAEMLPLLEYMKRTMSVSVLYNDHGYGVLPKPHELCHFWRLPQGEVHMTWDGFDYGYGKDANIPHGDGLDYVTVWLRDYTLLKEVRDEAWYRSVD